MTTPDSNAAQSPPNRFRQILQGIVKVLWRLSLSLLCLWGALAIYYSNLPWNWLRLVAALGFVAFGVWAIWRSGQQKMRLLFAGVFLGVVIWFATIPPSHDRQWRQEVDVMPRAIIDGDKVRLTGVRNYEYRTRDDFTVRYEERDVLLSKLTSVDLFISYWSLGAVGHTFVTFNFEDKPPICISIETRPEEGEGYAPIASMFKQYELIYVVGDERDLVGVRTDHRDEEVFLYEIRASPEAARRLFLVYLERINELSDRPEWYHLLKNNCTLNIVRYANAAGREGSFDLRHLINGWIDRYFYETGWVDNSMPFEELRERSHINAMAENAANAPDFSNRIRESLPGHMTNTPPSEVE
jgi:hypothetical protein